MFDGNYTSAPTLKSVWLMSGGLKSVHRFADMDARWRQFTALAWKNYRLQRRKPLIIFFIILFPTLYALLLMFLHSKNKYIVVAETKSWVEQPLEFHQNEHHEFTMEVDNKGTHYGNTHVQLLFYYTPDVDVTKRVMGHASNGSDKNISELFVDHSLLINKRCGLCNTVTLISFINL